MNEPIKNCLSYQVNVGKTPFFYVSAESYKIHKNNGRANITKHHDRILFYVYNLDKNNTIWLMKRNSKIVLC